MGEMLFRLSSSVYDDSKSGSGRVAREILGAFLSPMQGFNRLITGKTRRVRPNNHADYFHYNPTTFEVGIGERYLSEKGHAFQGAYVTEIGFTANHGNPFEKENYQLPEEPPPPLSNPPPPPNPLELSPNPYDGLDSLEELEPELEE